MIPLRRRSAERRETPRARAMTAQVPQTLSFSAFARSCHGALKSGHDAVDDPLRAAGWCG